MLYSSTLLALLPLALAAPAPAGPLDRRAPIISPRGVEIIPGKYIVKLKEGSDNTALEKAIALLTKATAKYVYSNDKFKGFASDLDDLTLDILRSLPQVCHHTTDKIRQGSSRR